MRFGTRRPDGPTPVVRRDNGLIFQSRHFRAACRDYRLRQEFITPYTPEQTGIVERLLRSLKESFSGSTTSLTSPKPELPLPTGFTGYNAERPHQALSYRSPRQFRGLILVEH